MTRETNIAEISQQNVKGNFYVRKKAIPSRGYKDAIDNEENYKD